MTALQLELQIWSNSEHSFCSNRQKKKKKSPPEKEVRKQPQNEDYEVVHRTC